MKILGYVATLIIGGVLGAMVGPMAKPFLAEIGASTEGYRVPEMNIHLSPTTDVMVWKSVIPFSEKNGEGLAAHRHLYSRILIPLTEGTLKRRDTDGKITDYALTIGRPIFLDKDTSEGMHTDENFGAKPIEVMIIQFNQSSPVTFDALTEEDMKTAVIK